jgi:hypothetical protein
MFYPSQLGMAQQAALAFASALANLAYPFLRESGSHYKLQTHQAPIQEDEKLNRGNVRSASSSSYS